MKWRCAACHRSDVPRYAPAAIVCLLCRDSAAARDLAWCPGCGTRTPHRVAVAELCKGRTYCRACKSAADKRTPSYATHGESARRFRENNPEQVREYRRRSDVRARARLRAKRRRLEHPEYFIAYRQRPDVREMERQNSRRYRRTHPDYGKREYMQKKLRAWRRLRGAR